MTGYDNPPPLHQLPDGCVMHDRMKVKVFVEYCKTQRLLIANEYMNTMANVSTEIISIVQCKLEDATTIPMIDHKARTDFGVIEDNR